MTPGRKSPESAVAESPRPLAKDLAAIANVSELLTFTDRLFRAGSLTEAAEAALDTICRVMGCNKAAVLRFDAAGVMRFVAWRGLSPAYRAVAEGHTPWAAGATQASPTVLTDLSALGDPALQAAAREEGVAALAFIPIWSDGQVVGKFMVYYPQPRGLNDEELALASFITRQLGFCLERLSTDERLRRERELLATIIDRIPAMVAVFSQDGRLIRDNAAIRRLGVPLGTPGAIGALLDGLLPDMSERKRAKRALEAAADGWTELTLKTSGQDPLETLWTSARLPEGSAVAIGLDVTQRKRIEQDLQRHARHLAELNGLSRQLASELDETAIVRTALAAAMTLTRSDWGAFVGREGEVEAVIGDAQDLQAPNRTLHADLQAALEGSDTVHCISEPAQQDRRHTLIAPLVLRSGAAYGAFLLVRREDPAFSSEHEILMASLASHAALAVENAALLAAAEQAAEAHRTAGEMAARLAAIVESSEDAILGKSLDGIITSWNAGAQRLFGYSAAEIVGRSVMMLVPPERAEEEAQILERVGAGLRIAPFETARLHKDGTLVEVSLAVSPVRDTSGRLVGAATIARDMSERRQAEARQKLLIREMDHRIKNLFTMVSGLVSVSARSADDPKQLATSLRHRLAALAEAHSLTLPQADGAPASISLHGLLRRVLAAYDHTEGAAKTSLSVSGDDIALNPGAVTALALLVYELATNAVKYGALGVIGGRVTIRTDRDGERLTFAWTETGGPPPAPPSHEGFGSVLTRATIEHQLGGVFDRKWGAGGLEVTMTLPLDRIV
jgi:PAS domain S-box-containing protein